MATIRALYRYGIKGGAGERVETLDLDADGLVTGDRSLMLVDASGDFLTQRELPALAKLRVRVEGDAATIDWPGAATIEHAIRRDGDSRSVRVWDDRFDAIDQGNAIAERLSAWLGATVRLVALPKRSQRALDPAWSPRPAVTSFADLAPLLVVSESSLDDLNDRRVAAGRSAIAIERFRPNVVIAGLDAWTEDAIASLVGPAFTLAFIKPCARCRVTELEPATGDATGDEVLASLAFRAGSNTRGRRGIFFGQNAMLASAGPARLTVGDRLEAVAAEGPNVALTGSRAGGFP